MEWVKRSALHGRMLRGFLAVFFVLEVVRPGDVGAAEIDWSDVGRRAGTLLSEYIRIDTTNPPGNEIRAAEFFAERFRDAGFRARVVESEKGRASIAARLRGTGAARPIILLNHLDVVPADAGEWTQPPFAGVIEDGWVYGRGAIDCKGMGVVEAMALLVLKESGATLSRDVIFLGTADEEVGGKLGAGWFAQTHLASLGEPEFLLNEGGGIREGSEGKRTYEVAVAEKTPLWVRITATGEPGHGSTPRGMSSVRRLIRALDRIRRIETEIRVSPEVQAYYSAVADGLSAGQGARYRNLSRSLADPDFRKDFLSRPRDAALVRNTISPTVLRGSDKTNVVPRTASADLDCRLLPGEDPDAFLRLLRDAVDDDGVEFATLLNFPSSSSASDTVLYRAITQVARQEGVPVVPSVLRGFTDSHFFRTRGVTSYGFIPVVMTDGEERRVHGVDERIALENLAAATRRLVAILRALDRIDRTRTSE